ncbi:hypothetical protein [Pseudonocardia sp. TMWB2A]|uniref:hypothetical protein n=1 Tax=Pseudonocardia sp. TMWB2A TaxID=687430 RepID=UPI00307E94F1
MRPTVKVALASLLAIPALAACQVKDDKADTGSTTTSSATPPAETPTQSTIAVEQKTEPVAQTVIQTQPGSDGVVVDLNKVAVTGDVLTVQLSVKAPNEDGKSFYMSERQISIIDDATAQRYSLLKDGEGNPLASPLSGTRVGNYISKGSTGIVWLKFPAPPATSKTVSINLPGVAPFDGVPVTR